MDSGLANSTSSDRVTGSRDTGSARRQRGNEAHRDCVLALLVTRVKCCSVLVSSRAAAARRVRAQCTRRDRAARSASSARSASRALM